MAAQILFKVSNDLALQKEQFKLEKDFTFYSDVISLAYYSIFYSAKALLINDNIKTQSPEVHRKTLEAFEKYFVNTGKLDVDLFLLYQKAIIMADELLGIFQSEREKRGRFTYQIMPQANLDPAKESIKKCREVFQSNLFNSGKEVILFL
jgi:uncharacterized protein (UPF0332 family)